MCSRQCSTYKPLSWELLSPTPSHLTPIRLFRQPCIHYRTPTSFTNHNLSPGIWTWDVEMLGSLSSSSLDSGGKFALLEQPTSTRQKEAHITNATREKAWGWNVSWPRFWGFPAPGCSPIFCPWELETPMYPYNKLSLPAPASLGNYLLFIPKEPWLRLFNPINQRHSQFNFVFLIIF